MIRKTVCNLKFNDTDFGGPHDVLFTEAKVLFPISKGNNRLIDPGHAQLPDSLAIETTKILAESGTWTFDLGNGHVVITKGFVYSVGTICLSGPSVTMPN